MKMLKARTVRSEVSTGRSALPNRVQIEVETDPSPRASTVWIAIFQGNRAIAAYGYGSVELASMSIRDLIHPSRIGLYAAHARQILENGSAVFDSIHRRRDGTPFDVEVSVRLIRTEGRQLRQSVVRDDRLGRQRLSGQAAAAGDRAPPADLVHRGLSRPDPRIGRAIGPLRAGAPRHPVSGRGHRPVRPHSGGDR